MRDADFDVILTEIDALCGGQPTAIRLVNAVDPFGAGMDLPFDLLNTA